MGHSWSRLDRGNESPYQVVEDTHKHGAHGSIYIAKHRQTQERYVVEFISTQRIDRFVLSEVINRHHCRGHQHIVKMVDVVPIKGGIHLVTDYIPQSLTLAKLMGTRQRKPFTEDEARHMFQQLVLAVDFLHRLNIVCRDLRPEHILICMGDRSPFLKICEFGFSKDVGDSVAKTAVPTALEFTAPERFSSPVHYDATKLDVWSCGVVLYLLLTLKTPFSAGGTSPRTMMQRAIAGEYEEAPLEHLSPGCRQFLRGLLQPDPARRWSCQQVMQQAWFKEGLPKSLEELVQFNVDRANASVHSRTLVDEEQRLRRLVVNASNGGLV